MTAPRRPAAPRTAGRRPAAPRPAATGTRPGATGARAPRAGDRPSSSRPPSKPTRAVPAPRAEHVQVRTPHLFTVRALVFSLVLLAAFVLVYPTLSSYLSQQAELRTLRAQVAAAAQRTEDLEAEKKRWDDPAYVSAQARERLGYVPKGLKPLRVVDPEHVPDTTPTADDGPSSLLDSSATQPWYATLWDSVEDAAAADDATGGTSPGTNDGASTDTTTDTTKDASADTVGGGSEDDPSKDDPSKDAAGD